MKRTIAFATILGLLSAAGLFATNARVESMGKTSTFFMDDVSIFDNPANINIYPNFLIGEAGHMTVFSDTNTNYKNQDPSEPYGGGILSFSFNKDKNAENRYPMLTVGAMLNHRSEMVDVLKQAAAANNHIIPDPKVPNSDFFLGYTLENGTMFGGHLYAARQNISVPGTKAKSSQAQLKQDGITTGIDDTDSYYLGKVITDKTLHWISNVVRGDVGINTPVSQNMDLEVSVGLGLLQYSGPEYSPLGKLDIPSYSGDDFSYFASARLFSTLLSLNGEIVPIAKFKRIAVRDYDVTEWDLGCGANITLDRGFFWAGLEFINNSRDIPTLAGGTRTVDSVCIPLSFGIERNVVWDWLVLRVGFRKVIYGTTTNQDNFSELVSNPEADMTPSDHVGGGIGINIEEKLKIDATMAEDMLYKWGNLVSGNSHHIFSRITATYSF